MGAPFWRRRSTAACISLVSRPMCSKLCSLLGSGGWSAGEDLDKAVARDVEVDEHERAVVVVQPESLFDAEYFVEAEGGVYVVGREGGVSEVCDLGYPPLFDGRLVQG